MNKIKMLLAFTVLVIVFISCVNDDAYNVPDILVSEPDIPQEQITTFKSVKSLYNQAVNSGNSTVVIPDEPLLYIQGYVISSDKYGNFFEELIIQNKIDDSNPDNDPRLGFKIDINVSNLSDTYQFGQKVYVKINGLTVGESSGVLILGKGNEVTVNQIQDSEYRNIVIRSNEIAEIEPKIVGAEELTERDENTLIKLENMQLNRFELGATYASESFDEFDGFRLFENCDSGVAMIMQTSTFSEFKSLIIPQGRGSIVGIFGRDYRDDFNVITINSVSDLDFDPNERCDPLELSCGGASTIGTGNLFMEDFESQKNNKPIEGNGWTNYIEAGLKSWEAYSSTATNASLGRSARFRSASSGDASNIGWLISPAINLDNQDGETLRFKTSNSLADSSFLEVLYTLDWDGTESGIKAATWGVFTDAYIVKDTDSFVSWFNSGVINLACISGIIHIAFKYTGSGQDSFDGVYELDDISIDFVE